MVTWVIEDEVFIEDTQPLVDALKASNHKVVFYNRPLYQNDIDSPKDLGIKPSEPVIVYCSLQLAKLIKNGWNVYPGVFYDIEKYRCTSYYPYLGKYLLNGNYVMLPYGDLIRQKEFLYNALGQDGAVFMRPNRGDKVFTGQLVYKEKYEETVNLFNFYQMDPDELVIVSEPRNINKEWRFVIVDGKPIASSLYKEYNVVGSEEGSPKEVWEYAEKVAKEYQPERVFILDICETKVGDLFVMEIGCFSCAGLYKCNRQKVVDEVSRVVQEEYEWYTSSSVENL